MRLGPYEIVGAIGAGGMGEVYRAHDTRLGRDVAIKVLPADTTQNADRLARFEYEAKAVAALNHPNVLALHDIGTDAGIAYAVMELLEGTTLRERLRAGRLSPLKAINYASQIARGLAAAHGRGIVHRDLKPENLFITAEGPVKILDFGLAQQLVLSPDVDTPATRFITEPGVVLGTPRYMSPEQILGQPVTVRSDLFAFGVVAYEMLTGSHPFARGTTPDTLAAIVREEAPPLSRTLPDLPPGVAGILERCLEKESAARPASAHDLALFLEAAGSTATEYRIPRSDLRRLRTRMLGITSALLILLSALMWVFVRTMTDRVIAEALDVNLARAERLVHRVHEDRLTRLALTARLVASFPELRALFATDAPTIRDYLLSYQQRNPGAPSLVAVGPDGTVIARTDDGPVGGREEWAAALEPGKATIVEMRDRLYHGAAATADAGGTIFGLIVAAEAIDNPFAAELREATQDEVIILSNTNLLASTLRGGEAPWRSRVEWEAASGRNSGTMELAVGTQQFAAREVVLAERPAVSAVVLTSRDEAAATFRRIQTGVLWIGMLSIALAAIGSLWIGRLVRTAWPEEPS
jgi:Protein kinase domain/Double sensory domain of two-component sensor kinase